MKWISNFLKTLKYVAISSLALFSFYGLSNDTFDPRRNFCENCGKQEVIVAEEMSVKELAYKCKSEWSSKACSQIEKLILFEKIQAVCGAMPERTHAYARYLFASYISIPMLNIAFTSYWSYTGSPMSWPICVVCLLEYPMDPYWEQQYKPDCKLHLPNRN